jgi:molybdate transport system substrate-binding protein
MNGLTLLLLLLLLGVLGACGVRRPIAIADPAKPSPMATDADAAVAPVAAAGKSKELNVFAAASLTDAFNKIGQHFEAATGAAVTFNFAGSQQLAQQIGQGAPADVFASANTSQMDVVIEAGAVQPGTQRTFACNRLVVVYPHDNPAKLRELQDLARPGVRLVLAAPEVPAGQYALDFLDKAVQATTFSPSFRDDVLANVVSYEENVRTVLSKVALGEADAGFVYRSDITPAVADQVGRIDIPDTLNTIAEYPIAPLVKARTAALAQQFVAYVRSPEAQRILVDYGFLAADDIERVR